MAKETWGEGGAVAVSPDTRLTPDGLEQFLEAARLECSARRSDPLLNLTSTDPDLLQSALFDCLVVGRRDPRYLTLVRSSLQFIGDQKSFFMAIDLLAHATPHPDVFWHKDNYIDHEIARVICKSYRWTPVEIAMLLARLPEEGMWSRGTIGQSLCMILLEDPSLDWSIDRLLTEAFREQELTWRSCWIKGEPFGPKWVRTDRKAIILPSLTLSLHLAADPRARLAELVERLPPLKQVETFTEIAEEVSVFGYIDILAESSVIVSLQGAGPVGRALPRLARVPRPDRLIPVALLDRAQFHLRPPCLHEPFVFLVGVGEVPPPDSRP
jgi:hypothetical protein